jgi:hypothetical protein
MLIVSSALRGPFSIVGILPALRGLFFLVDVLQTLSGLFSIVDVLPGSPLSGHLPFVAFCLSGPFSLSLVGFSPCGHPRLGRSVGSLTGYPALRDGRRLTGTDVLWAPLRLSLVVFLLSRSVQSVPSCRSAYCDASLVPVACRSFSRSVGMPPLTSLLELMLLLCFLFKNPLLRWCRSFSWRVAAY